ncbi:MAG TPA: hypothetical protein VM073_12040 [Usitatibacter sp.]|nr:hypothetical protein [Usitatibacter sp.]
MRTTVVSVAIAALLSFPVHAAKGSARDQFLVGGSVRQAVPVEGDLIGVGGSVEVAAPVSGDVVVTGGDIRVGAAVAQDVYAAGGNVEIDGTVGRNVRVAGGNVEVHPAGRIEGNLSAFGGTVVVRGPVKGELRAASGDVVLDAEVGGDVHVAAGTLTLGPNANVGGRVTLRGNGDTIVDPAARISAGVTREPGGRSETRVRVHREPSHAGWSWTIGMMLLAAAIAAVFPAGTRRVGEKLRRDPFVTMFFGFAVLVCAPVAVLMLAITIIGIPVAVALALGYVLLLVVGYAALAVVFGDAVLERVRGVDAARRAWRAAAAMIAILAMAVVARVPVLGGFFVFAALLAGVGALVLALRREETPLPAA